MAFLTEAIYKNSALYKARLATFLIYEGNIQGSFREGLLKGLVYERLDQLQMVKWFLLLDLLIWLEEHLQNRLSESIFALLSFVFRIGHLEKNKTAQHKNSMSHKRRDFNIQSRMELAGVWQKQNQSGKAQTSSCLSFPDT